MVKFRTGRRLLLAAAVSLGLATAVACEYPSRAAQIATFLILLPGNDTVYFDLESGAVTSGPIALFTDAEFSTVFLTQDGSIDIRVEETRYTLDVVPADTTKVKFARTTGFSGTLQHVAAGDTEVYFALRDRQDNTSVFACNVPITLY